MSLTVSHFHWKRLNIVEEYEGLSVIGLYEFRSYRQPEAGKYKTGHVTLSH